MSAHKLFSDIEGRTEPGNPALAKALEREIEDARREILENSIGGLWNAPSEEDLEDYTEDEKKEILGVR